MTHWGFAMWHHVLFHSIVQCGYAAKCLFVCEFDSLCSTAQIVVVVSVPSLVATGGEEEAMAACEEAMQAMFGLQLERFSHVQPHRNPENGKLRWECLEMWPMQASLALVCSDT